MGYFLKSDIMGLSLVLGLGCGISDNLVKAAAVCLLSPVSDFEGQDPFHAPCSCSRLSVEDLGEQDSHGFVFCAPGEARRAVLGAQPEPVPLPGWGGQVTHPGPLVSFLCHLGCWDFSVLPHGFLWAAQAAE